MRCLCNVYARAVAAQECGRRDRRPASCPRTVSVFGDGWDYVKQPRAFLIRRGPVLPYGRRYESDPVVMGVLYSLNPPSEMVTAS